MSKRRATHKRTTIKDIASVAEVDPSTVARALQGSDRVKASTRQRIEKIAHDLGYVPSAMARSLVTQRSHLLGVVIPGMTNPFFASLVRGIQEEAANNKLGVLIRNTDGDQQAEQEAVKLFNELHVDGIIVPMARCSESFYSSLNSNTPTIHINRDEAPLTVSCDSVSGTQALVRHLLDLGHKQIAFVNGPAGPAREPKYVGYCNALKASDIAPNSELFFSYDGTFESVELLANDLINAMPECTAVFAWNDVCAIGLMHALRQRKIMIPQQLAICGHDNIEFAALAEPPLTSVEWPMYELGCASVLQILNIYTDEKTPSPTIPAPKLIVRASTGAHNPHPHVK